MSRTLIKPDQLTGTIRSYLTAHAARHTDVALELFAPTAVVADLDYRFAMDGDFITELVSTG